MLGAVIVIPLVEQAHALTASRGGPIKRIIERGLSIAREVVGSDRATGGGQASATR